MLVAITPSMLPPVHAQVSCGQTITTNEVLTQDLSCSSGALTFGASVVFDCQGHKITGTGFYANGYGGITIKNCVLQFNGDDIDLENNASNKVVNCTLMTAGGNYGVFTRYSNLNSFINNSVTGGYNGFWLEGSSNNILTGNRIFGNSNGVYITGNVIYSSFNLLQNNTVYSNSIGLDVDALSSQNILKFNSVVLNAQWGIYVQGSNSNNITLNVVENNTAANLQLRVANSNSILSNTVEYSQIGITMDGSSRNAIKSNLVSNNGLGINIPGPVGPSYVPSDNNSIYNNIFRNTVNGLDAWKNYWNTTETFATNILGGHYTGGNYWSDYNGTDTDQDYIGDTALPYNSTQGIVNGGDYRPLMLPAGYLDYKGVSPGSMSVFWGQSYQLDFANYQLQRSTSGSPGPWATVDTITTETNTTDFVSGLSPSGVYWWRLRDYSTNGTSFSLNVLMVTQPGKAVLAGKFVNSNSMSFNWTNNAQYGGQLRFKAYTLMESVSGGGYFPAALIAMVSSKSYTIQHLVPSTNYSFYLVTTDSCASCTFQLTSNSSSNTIAALTPAILSATAQASPLLVDVGQAVTFSCLPSGGTLPFQYSWNLGDGGTASSQIVGHVYMFSGVLTVKCSVTDALGNQTSASVIVTVHSDPVVATPSAQPASVDLGQTALFSTSASGGSGGYSYSWTGLPPGCASADSASISCRVASLGTYDISVAATDSSGLLVYSAPLTFVPAPDPVLVGFTASPSIFDISGRVTFDVSGAGGSGRLSFAYSGLPPGCQTANSTTITCTPTLTGMYTVTVSVTDSNGFTVSSSLLVTVNPSLAVTALNSTARLVDVGQNFTLTVSSSGGSGPSSYTYTALPPGCQTASSPGLTCISSRSGNYTITVIVTDSASATASSSISIRVNADPKITSFTAPSGILTGQQLELNVSGRGGTGALSYSYSGLPPGCTSVNAPTLSCNPSSSGDYRITTTITDANGMTDVSYANVAVTQSILGVVPVEGYAIIAGIAIVIGSIALVGLILIRNNRTKVQNK